MLGAGRAYHRLSFAEQEYLNALHIEVRHAERQLDYAKRFQLPDRYIEQAERREGKAKERCRDEQLRVMGSGAETRTPRGNPNSRFAKLKTDARKELRLGAAKLREAKAAWSAAAVEGREKESRRLEKAIKEAESGLLRTEESVGAVAHTLDKPIREAIRRGERAVAPNPAVRNPGEKEHAKLATKQRDQAVAALVRSARAGDREDINGMFSHTTEALYHASAGIEHAQAAGKDLKADVKKDLNRVANESIRRIDLLRDVTVNALEATGWKDPGAVDLMLNPAPKRNARSKEDRSVLGAAIGGGLGGVLLGPLGAAAGGYAGYKTAQKRAKKRAKEKAKKRKRAKKNPTIGRLMNAALR